MASDDPVEVYAAGDATEAYFVRDLLAEAGIEATIVGEPLGSVLGDVPFFMAGPRLWVRPSDANQARPIVAEYEGRLRDRSQTTENAQHEPPTGHLPEELFCYYCGEAVAGGEQTCHACGKTLEWNDNGAKPQNSEATV